MVLQYLNIVVEPWSFTGSNDVVLKVHIRTLDESGLPKEAVVQRILPMNDFEPMFERTWNHMGKTIASHLKGTADPIPEAEVIE